MNAKPGINMTKDTQSLIEAQSIHLSYGDFTVISDLSFTIQSGTFIGLIGPNGAGKTSLLLALSGQFQPQEGRILYNESNIYEKNNDYKQVVGFVHETPFMYPFLSAEEFLHFIARVKMVPTEERDAQIQSALQSVFLYEEKHKLTSTLSMGMRKKLAIAAALLGSPKIIFMDEALNGIDIESAFHIKKMLKNLVNEGLTVILSSHVLEVIEKICDRYLVLKKGEIVADVNAADFTHTKKQSGVSDLEQYIIKILKK